MKNFSLLAVLIFLIVSRSIYAIDYFVDGENPVASDSNPGTNTLPLKTIEGAKVLIRIFKQTNVINEKITVWVRKGTYTPGDTIAFSSLDSGTEQFPISYESFSNEKVVVSGKKNLSVGSFQTVTAADPLYNQLDASAKGVVKSINLNDFGITDYGTLNLTNEVNNYIQLFINDEWLPIARWPDVGENTTTPTISNVNEVNLIGVTVPAVAGKFLANGPINGVTSFKRVGLVDTKQYYLYRNSYVNGAGQTIFRWLICTQSSGYPAAGTPFWYCYYDFGSYSDYPVLPFSSMTLTTGALSLAPNSISEDIIQMGFNRFQKAETPDSFYMNYDRMKKWANAKDLIAAGFFTWRWADFNMEVKTIDTINRKITLKSVPSYGIDEKEGGRIYMYNLIEEITKPGEWYLNKLTGKLYLWPTANFNSSSVSVSILNKPLFSTTDTKYIKFKGITFDGGRNNTINISNGLGIDIDDCQLLNNGITAINIRSTKNSFIQNTIIKGSGGRGIDAHYCGSRPLLIESNNIIRNCDISQMGKRKMAYTTAIAIDGTGTDSNVGFQILNNEIYNMPHTAILFTGNEHKILRNKIHDVCKTTSDAGAIYTGRDWSYRGNLIKNNFIYNVNSEVGDDVSGVYYDDCVSGVESISNIFYNIDGYGVLHGGGRDSVVKNNVFYKCLNSAYFVDDRGRKFINNNLPNNSWNFYDRISTWGGFDYQAEPWKSKYPLLYAIPKDWSVTSSPTNKWLYPGGSIISGNIGFQNSRFYAQGNYITPGEDLKLFLKEYANNVENVDPLFKDKDNLNFELMPNSPAYSIPGFEAIPFDQIGIQYPITVSSGSNGNISPASVVWVTKGFAKTFTVTPASNYLIDTVTVDGVNIGNVSSYTFSNVASKHTISATFKVASNSITANAAANGTISPNGVTNVSVGGNQTYSISPNSSYEIETLLVDGISVAVTNSYSFNNVTAPHTISVSFKLKTYTIQASASSNGSMTPSGNVLVTHGSNQTFEITPANNFVIDTVLVDGTSVGAVSSYTFSNVTNTHTINASFKPKIITHTILSSAGSNGTISPNGSVVVNNGASQTFVITPNSGYHISDVLVDGISAGAIASYTFQNVTSAHTISATFALKPIKTYLITVSAGLNGTITPNGNVTVNEGANQTFEMKGVTGYLIDKVLVDGNDIGSVSSYIFTNIQANHTISASFKAQTFTIASSAGANGSISPTGNTIVNFGGNQTYTFTANLGYQVADVIVDGVSFGKLNSYTFSNITASHTIAVNFQKKTYTIVASSDTNGTISPSGSSEVQAGSRITFRLYPKSGFKINAVLVDGVSVGVISRYVFRNVNAPHTIAVTYKPVKTLFKLEANVANDQSFTDIQMIGANGQKFKITPHSDLKIDNVLVDGNEVNVNEALPFGSIELILSHKEFSSFKVDEKKFQMASKEIIAIEKAEKGAGMQILIEGVQYSANEESDFEEVSDEITWGESETGSKKISVPYLTEEDERFSLKVVTIDEIESNNTVSGESSNNTNSSLSSNGGGGCSYSKNGLDYTFLITFFYLLIQFKFFKKKLND